MCGAMVLVEGMNEICLTERGTVRKKIKKISAVPPILSYNILNALLINNFDFYYPSVNERIENELNARKVLLSLGVQVPKTHEIKGNVIERDFIEGETFCKFCETAENEEIYNLAFQIGRETGAVHKKNYAFLDRKTRNIIVDENRNLWSIDHELFSKSSGGRKKSDIFIFEASLKHLPPERYEPAIDGFEMGYGDTIHLYKNSYIDEIIIDRISKAMQFYDWLCEQDSLRYIFGKLP